jgi:hypothetical protein
VNLLTGLLIRNLLGVTVAMNGCQLVLTQRWVQGALSCQ